MDSWYLALLGLAEHFRSSKPPDYLKCIQCLMAVFKSKPPPKVEARTHLQLGTILYHHTNNIDLAKSHMEQAVSGPFDNPRLFPLSLGLHGKQRVCFA